MSNGGQVAMDFGPYYKTSQRSKEAEREALGMPALSPEVIAGERYGEMSAYLAEGDKQKQLQIQQGYLGLSAEQVRAQRNAQKTQSTTSMISGGAGVAGTALAIGKTALPALTSALGLTSTAAPALTATSGASVPTMALTAGEIPVEIGAEATTSTLTAGGGGVLPAVSGAIASGAEAVGSVFETIGTALLALFTVICTELYRQKITNKKMLEADLKYGKWVLQNDPYTYIGYHTWAKHAVKLMRKSKLFTKFVCVFALPWEKEMAYRMGFLKKGNLFGYMLMELGVPVCRFIGKRVNLKEFIAKQAVPQAI